MVALKTINLFIKKAVFGRSSRLGRKNLEFNDQHLKGSKESTPNDIRDERAKFNRYVADLLLHMQKVENKSFEKFKNDNEQAIGSIMTERQNYLGGKVREKKSCQISNVLIWTNIQEKNGKKDLFNSLMKCAESAEGFNQSIKDNLGKLKAAANSGTLRDDA